MGRAIDVEAVREPPLHLQQDGKSSVLDIPANKSKPSKH